MRLDGDAWREFFNSFQQEAFRLETLPAYKVDSEQAEFEAFLATGKLDISKHDSWLVRVRHFRETGRWIGRVRVITQPLTDYVRFEFGMYQHNVRAGEDVRILDLTGRSNPGLPQQDFWMFDESRVVRMDYESDGTQIGRELLENIDPTPYVTWKRLALEHAEPFPEYYAKL